MIYGKPYQYPPAVFEPGDKVKFYLSEDKDMGDRWHTVAACDHCFCWLEELPHQVAVWRLKKIHNRKRAGGRPKKSKS